MSSAFAEVNNNNKFNDAGGNLRMAPTTNSPDQSTAWQENHTAQPAVPVSPPTVNAPVMPEEVQGSQNQPPVPISTPNGGIPPTVTIPPKSPTASPTVQNNGVTNQTVVNTNEPQSLMPIVNPANNKNESSKVNTTH